MIQGTTYQTIYNTCTYTLRSIILVESKESILTLLQNGSQGYWLVTQSEPYWNLMSLTLIFIVVWETQIIPIHLNLSRVHKHTET